MNAIPESCPRCGETQIVKAGKHYNQKGASQRYQCKKCGTSFCNEGYFRGKHQLSLLQYTVKLYQDGDSYEKIQKLIKEQFGISISRTTIGEWIRKLSIQPRRKSCGNQKQKLNRELVEIGILTTVRIATSQNPEKFYVLNNETRLLEVTKK
jgi:transposase-like protein